MAGNGRLPLGVENGLLVNSQQELDSANNLNELESGFFFFFFPSQPQTRAQPSQHLAFSQMDPDIPANS